MNSMQMISLFLGSFVIGILVGNMYSSYVTFAIMDENFNLWDVLMMTFDVITGRIGK